MGRNKMIAKSCPKCEMQVAVASKSCKCGHTFFVARRSGLLPLTDSDLQMMQEGETLRRTSRVNRAQRTFYDDSDYQKQKKRSPKKRSHSRSIDEEYKKEKNESATARARRRRALRRAAREAPPAAAGERARDPPPQLRPAQLATCALILQEINRKMRCVTWQPRT